MKKIIFLVSAFTISYLAIRHINKQKAERKREILKNKVRTGCSFI